MSAIEDLAAFLDSVAAWYPGGVPLDAMSDAELRAPEAQRPSVLFVVAGASSGEEGWDGEEGDLLRKIVTNGLQLSIDSVRLVRKAPGGSSSEWRREISSAAPLVVVALGRTAGVEIAGRELERGQCLEIDGVTVVCTHSLADVLADASLKRTLWEDLQKVIQELRQP